MAAFMIKNILHPTSGLNEFQTPGLDTQTELETAFNNTSRHHPSLSVTYVAVEYIQVSSLCTGWPTA